eukprot:8598015-Pyramimonas_sp.AAC.1
MSWLPDGAPSAPDPKVALLGLRGDVLTQLTPCCTQEQPVLDCLLAATTELAKPTEERCH